MESKETIATEKTTQKKSIDNLEKFLQKNSKLNLKTTNLLDAEQIAAINWTGFKKSKDQLLLQLKAYQRLLNIIPSGNADLIKAFLKEDIHSAIQIAAIPKQQFLERFGHLTEKQELLAACHNNAMAIRAKLLLNYVKRKQQGSNSNF